MTTNDTIAMYATMGQWSLTAEREAMRFSAKAFIFGNNDSGWRNAAIADDARDASRLMFYKITVLEALEAS